MGSDMVFQRQHENESRSRSAVKLARLLNARIIYNETPNTPAQMPLLYSGMIEYTDPKGDKSIIRISKYEDAVKIYELVQQIKKELG